MKVIREEEKEIQNYKTKLYIMDQGFNNYNIHDIIDMLTKSGFVPKIIAIVKESDSYDDIRDNDNEMHYFSQADYAKDIHRWDGEDIRSCDITGTYNDENIDCYISAIDGRIVLRGKREQEIPFDTIAAGIIQTR